MKGHLKEEVWMGSRKAAENHPKPWEPAPARQTWKRLLSHGFRLALLWLLQARKWEERDRKKIIKEHLGLCTLLKGMWVKILLAAVEIKTSDVVFPLWLMNGNRFLKIIFVIIDFILSLDLECLTYRSFEANLLWLSFHCCPPVYVCLHGLGVLTVVPISSSLRLLDSRAS